MNLDLRAGDVRPFVGAADFALSRAFYVAGLAGRVRRRPAGAAGNGGQRFCLQDRYAREWLDNTMLHVTVADARAAHQQVSALPDTGRFPGARVAPPKRGEYGALATHVWDPAGVLPHLAQWLPRHQRAR